MKAVGYVRRSAKSEETTVSLPEQAEQIERYCERKGITLVAFVCHDGVSGGERSRFEDIHQVLTDSDSRCVVFCYLDRFGRDAAAVLNTVEILTTNSVEVHEATQGRIDPNDPTQKLMLSVRAAMDENYRNVIKAKTRSALRFKRDKGQRYSNIAPFGYAYQAGRMVPEPEEQRALRIIADCQSRGLGARRTQRALYDARYRGRMGVTTIHRLLQLPSIKDKLPANYFASLE